MGTPIAEVKEDGESIEPAVLFIKRRFKRSEKR